MSTIKISDLHPTGSELFSDSEGYMSELGDNELSAINGGWSGWKCSVAVSLISVLSIVATATGSPTVSVVTATF